MQDPHADAATTERDGIGDSSADHRGGIGLWSGKSASQITSPLRDGRSPRPSLEIAGSSSTTGWQRYGYVAALLLIVAVGSWIRLAPIAERPFWFDEADTWRAVEVGDDGQPIGYADYLTWQHHFEHAPLGFVLAKVSTDLTGSTEPWAYRLPSALAGILCILAGFWVAKLALGSAGGLATAALIACDPNMVDQSQQCRMYTLLTLLMLLAIGMTAELLRRPQGRWWRYGLLGGIFGLLLLTTQFSLVVWVGTALAVIITWLVMLVYAGANPRRPWTVAGGFTAAYVIGMGLACIGVIRILQRVLGGGGDGADLGAAHIAREIAVAANDLLNLTPVALLLFPLAAIGVILIGLKRHAQLALVLLTVAVVAVLIIFPFRKMHHFMAPRYLAGLQPMLWIGLAALPVLLKPRLLRWGATALLVLVLAGLSWQVTHLNHWWHPPERYLVTPMIQRVAQARQPDEALVYFPQALELLGRYHGQPTDPVLDAGLYENYRLADQPQVPGSFDAPGTWLVMAMMNYDAAVARARVAVRALASHYHVNVSQQQLDQMLAKDRVVAIRFRHGELATVWQSQVDHSR